MAFRVEISPQAFEDLDIISAYIRRRASFESAERWFNGVIAAIRTLCDGATAKIRASNRLPRGQIELPSR